MEDLKIVLADDHSIVRQGIKQLLKSNKSIEIVGEACTGKEALEQVARLAPHLLVTDISMPLCSGIEVTSEISSKYPDTKVLILSMYDDDEYVIKAIEAGASGYVTKEADEDEILAAVESIAAGRTYYSRSVSETMAKTLIRKRAGFRHEESETLTDREQEVLKCIVEGFSNKIIADKLYISIRTVDTHRSNIMKKMKTRNTAELVKKAIRDKVVHFD